jgi:hypothetical protein
VAGEPSRPECGGTGQDRYRTEGDCGFDLVAERPIKIPVEKRAPPAGNRASRRGIKKRARRS